jgi:hypothetical protein
LAKPTASLTSRSPNTSTVDRIPAGRLYRLAQFLKIPVAYFFDGLPAGGARPPDHVAGDAFPSRETTELVAAYYRIGDPKLRHCVAVVQLIRVMSEAAS